ncbi:hypothetical protein LCGC14_2461440 [marine sediment metagenome]|uniref:DUF7694 domain-containing protein n=1 Tax=marine sediment metagenome TaxID=412755 RepID=A0A0F9BD56_9ZZZZ
MIRIPREMEIYRRAHPLAPNDRGNHQNGAFVIPSRSLMIIVSSGEGWDHVSVSLKERCPTWDEMEWVRRKFFEDDDTVIEIHPPLNDYVNRCETCLHMWRPWNYEIPLPPKDHIA